MSSDRPNHALVEDLQRRLAAAADPAVKAWWERYVKHDTVFRGVPMGAIRDAVRAWRTRHALERGTPPAQADLAFALIGEPLIEDKLAGILYLQDFLLDAVPWPRMLARWERAFRRRHVFDWSVCDWACVRVFGPLMRLHGRECMEAVATWARAPYLWQARAGVVAFVPLVGRRDALFPAARRLALTGCARLIRREERFAKTAVGWVLRDLSVHEPRAVARFVAAHRRAFTREALVNAIRRLPPEQQARLRQPDGRGSGNVRARAAGSLQR